MENSIMDIMGITLEKLKTIASGDRIISSPVVLDNETVVVPYSKISLGFVCGGGEYSESQPKDMNRFPFATASGGGVTITPCGFLVCKNGTYTVTKTDGEDGDNKWIELAKSAIKAMKK
ncbi:MAG: GerW family sporulation protein [Clostridia bacterium]|nr:GerW family sporulation protein [Clostridia bacterium]